MMIKLTATKSTRVQLSVLLLAILAIVSCKNDDDETPVLTGVSKAYPIVPSQIGADHNMTGEIRIGEFSDGSAVITVTITAESLEVQSTNFPVEGVPIEATIHSNDIESGPSDRELLITLNIVGTRRFGTPLEEGVSQTFVSQLDDGTSITYNELLTLNAHIRLEYDKFLYALGNIGGN